MYDELIAQIKEEIKRGCTNESRRREQHKINVDFYRGEFDAYMVDCGFKGQAKPKHERTSLVMQRAVHVLGAIYAKSPSREFQDYPELTKWYQEQSVREGLDGLLMEADRLAIAADVSAIQIVGSDDPLRPVRFQLWSADDFIVWVSPDDPTVAIAVATIDTYDNQRRMNLWTAETLTTFITAKLSPGQTAGGTAFSQDGIEEENYYGILPFVFMHCNPPSTYFWNHGIGDCLYRVNNYFNHFLTDGGESVRYAQTPEVTTFGNTSKRPNPRVPGGVWELATLAYDEAGNGIAPQVQHLQPDLGFVDVGWSDAKEYLSHSLQMVGIPESSIRMVQGEANSGIQIVCEQLPLAEWLKGRQRQFNQFERSMAFVTITVAKADHIRLFNTANETLDPEWASFLSVRWPNFSPDMPLTAEEQSTQDQSDMALGITSAIKIVMRRYNYNREEAIEYLKGVKDDIEEIASLGLTPKPLNQGNPNASDQPTQSDRSGTDDESEDESDQG